MYEKVEKLKKNSCFPHPKKNQKHSDTSKCPIFFVCLFIVVTLGCLLGWDFNIPGCEFTTRLTQIRKIFPNFGP